MLAMKVVLTSVSGTGIPSREFSPRERRRSVAHPIPSATAGLDEMQGKGSNGGVWEWTSTLFDTHDGLVPTDIFPGYSADFFDGVHHVVVSRLASDSGS
jgi:formylglycine-generating enzyme required for sulfatase activity